jgi:hypothetical protein
VSGTVLFEQSHRGDVWRLEVARFDGHTFVNWRKWYRDGDALKPTKQGLTFPLERLGELEKALAGWRAAKALSDLSRSS